MKTIYGLNVQYLASRRLSIILLKLLVYQIVGLFFLFSYAVVNDCGTCMNMKTCFRNLTVTLFSLHQKTRIVSTWKNQSGETEITICLFLIYIFVVFFILILFYHLSYSFYFSLCCLLYVSLFMERVNNDRHSKKERGTSP